MIGACRLGLAWLLVAAAVGQGLAWGQYQGPPGPVGSDFRAGPGGTSGLRRYTEQSSRATPATPGTIIPRDEPNRVIPYILWNPNPPDFQVIDWRDGSGVPASAINTVLIGTDSNGRLHIRRFDAAGNLVTDLDETQLPANQAKQVALPSLKQQLARIALPPALNPEQKAQLLDDVTTLVGRMPSPRPLLVAGPAGGLTLEQAIDRLAVANLGTRIAAEETVQARADRVTAGLRANPQLVAGIQPIPYGSFNTNTQGGPTLYTVGVAVPLDLSGKRRNRIRGADIAVLIADATYRENVRNQIDNLYTAFIDALAAQTTLDQARAIASSNVAATPGQPLVMNRGAVTLPLAEAEDALREKSRSLSDLLGLELPQNGIVEVRGTLLDAQREPPKLEDLIAQAREHRPDLAAQRLTVAKAQADLNLFYANRFDDWTLTFTPYAEGNGQPYGQVSGRGWGVALNVPTPVFNRQQGQIQRACSEIRKQNLRLAQIEKTVVADVRAARDKYDSTWKAMCALEARLRRPPVAFNDPRPINGPAEVQRLGTEMNRLMVREYRQALTRYQTALVEHRKSMLRINTAVGWLVVPLSPPPGSSPRECTQAELATPDED